MMMAHLLMFPMCDSLSRVVVLRATVTIIHKQVFELHGASRKRQLSKKNSSSTEFDLPAKMERALGFSHFLGFSPERLQPSLFHYEKNRLDFRYKLSRNLALPTKA
jgi:hypothetical protein